MSDLFHPCTPDWQIQSALAVAEATPRHIHIFCTKNPRRYQEFNPWPENCWLLTTITKQEDEWRIVELLKAVCRVRGLSLEPLLGAISLKKVPYRLSDNTTCASFDASTFISWLIIGAMTGAGSKQHQPEPEWAQGLIGQARIAGVPVFLKDNLKWPEKIQEFPS